MWPASLGPARCCLQRVKFGQSAPCLKPSTGAAPIRKPFPSGSDLPDPGYSLSGDPVPRMSLHTRHSVTLGFCAFAWTALPAVSSTVRQDQETCSLDFGAGVMMTDLKTDLLLLAFRAHLWTGGPPSDCGITLSLGTQSSTLELQKA